MKQSLVLDTSLPLLDIPRLRSIRALGEPDDADGFFKGLLTIFFERAPALLADLEQAVAARDAHRVEKLAHALKGSAGNLGAARMMHFAERLEAIGRSKHLTDEVGLLLEALKLAYPETRGELLKHQ